MAAISSIFWVIGLILAVVIAPQLRIWIWGPTMLCFAISGAFALPAVWKSLGTAKARSFLIFPGIFLALWVAARAFLSPVAELVQSDYLLTSMGVATFLCFHASAGKIAAQRVLLYGIALLLLASVIVILKQVADPTFYPVFPNTEARHPAGFFGHYSYGASFLIPTSLLIAAAAIHSKQHVAARALLGFLALLTCYAVYLTNSRGGFIGMGGGLALLILISILSSEQRQKKWFGPAIIIVPFILIGVGIFFVKGLLSIQETRGTSGTLLDNAIRFYLAGIAMSCIALHPLIGGGSRSFSWECFQFWDTDAMGYGFAKPEHVHNELLQTFSDYGLIGGGLAFLVLITAIIAATIRIVTTHDYKASPLQTSWLIGGLAGLTGIALQSFFEGIFRLPAGATLLTFCLAACLLPLASNREKATPSGIFTSTIACLVSIPFLALLAFFGWKGTSITTKAWAAYFSFPPISQEEKIDRLSAAIDTWPLYSLYQDRGQAYKDLAQQNENPDIQKELRELSLSDFTQAFRLHPFHPELAVNAGIMAGLLEQDEKADLFFEKGIKLQGEMEATFYAHKYSAQYLTRKAIRQYSDGDLKAAISSFERAHQHNESIVSMYHPGFGGADEVKARNATADGLAKCLAQDGQYQRALELYELTATQPYGRVSHYYSSIMLGELAADLWSKRRSSDALRLFMEAKQRIALNHGQLPEGVTPEQVKEWRQYLDQSINFLKAAKFEPSDNLNFPN